MAYLGKTPSQAVRSRYYFTASGGETSLSPSEVTGLSFTDANYVDVSLNGVALVSGTDYTATPSTNTISGLAALTASDVVEIVVYDTFSVFGGNVNGDFNISGGTLAAEAATVTSLTTTGNITFGDNDKAIFGAGSDLQIYHNGSASVISDVGTGNFFISGDNDVFISKADLSEVKAKFSTNGAVTLYYDNTARLATTTSGIDVTGTVTADALDIGANNPRIRFDDSDTSNNGEITLDNTALRIEADEDNAVADSKIYLRVDGSNKVTVDSTGVDVTGSVTLDAAGNVTDGSGRPTVVLNNTSSGGWSTGTEYGSLEFHTDDTTSGAGLRAKISAKTGGTNGSRGVLGFTTRDSSGTTVETMTMDDTGVDVTGTVTADGLETVNGADIDMDAVGSGQLKLDGNGYASAIALNAEGMNVYTTSAVRGVILGTNETQRLRVDGGGDISFYDSTGVTQGLFWDASTQRLGLGTTSPTQATLHVDGGQVSARFESTSDSTSYVQFGASGTTSYGQIAMTGDDMTLRTSYTNRMTIDSSGNVGIGTTSPSKTLDVDGQLRIRNGGATGYALLEYGASATATNNWHVGSEGDGTYRFYNGNFGAGTERMRITSAGNVGIGTSSPSKALEVSGSSGELLRLSVAADGGTQQSFGIGFATGNTNTHPAVLIEAKEFDASDSRANLVFSTRNSNSDVAPAERMRIDSSGTALIGATSANAAGSKIELHTPANTANVLYMLKSTQVEMAMGFKSSTDSNFYIGTGSTNVGTYGVYLTNTGNSWTSVSDERKKTVVEPISNASEKVSSLRTVIGYFNHDEDQTRRPFLMAQDVQAVLPEAVNVQQDEDSTLGLAYTDVIPLLTAALKESIAKIETLEAKVAALESN